MVPWCLPCPAYNGRGSKERKASGRREVSGELGRGDVGVGRRDFRKVFKLLFLVPQGEMRGWQTQGSLQ